MRHIQERGSISPVEALACHGIFRLAARIRELRLSGHNIQTKMCRDVNGRTYARYHLGKKKGGSK